MITRWFEDLLALAEAGTLTEAASRRNVTQPAFTRRIQQIEHTLGVTLLDRSRRPAQLSPAVRRKLSEIRAISGDLRELAIDLRGDGLEQRRVVIAAQHSLAVGILPPFVEEIAHQHLDLSVHLHSADRDACYSALMTRKASIMIAYETKAFRVVQDDSMLETVFLGCDKIVAVAAPQLASSAKKQNIKSKTIPTISYPRGSFFGDLFAHQIVPSVQFSAGMRVVCETSLIPAAIAMAASGAGIAWLPLRLCARHIQDGLLEPLGPEFGEAVVDIVCARRRVPKAAGGAVLLWDRLCEFMTRNS